tara:strand:+ start:1064 stop:1432 length:369 start_codon:yes stop_codon:yes gene_type:complete
MKFQYRSFKEAKKFVKKLKLKNVKEWQKYCSSDKRPNEILFHPDNTYKKQGKWNGWRDFLGTGIVATQNREYLSTTDTKIEARMIAKKFNIKNKLEWRQIYKNGKIPKNLPVSLWNQYGRKK